MLMRRWLPPILFGVVLFVIAYQVTMVETPRLLMAGAERRFAAEGGYNAMSHGPLNTAASRIVVRPSPDLLYSSCPYDVGKGPVLIDVAPVPARYWSLSVFDANTDVAFVRNNVQAGGQPMHVALIGEKGGQAPPGYEPVPVKGKRGIAQIRILIDNPAAFPAIDAARKSSGCRALTPA